MNHLNLNLYQQLALRTAPAHSAPDGAPLNDLAHGAMGVCTEGGELLDVVKRHEFYGKPVDWVNIREEMGDVLWYLALLARASGTTLNEVAAANIRKLEARYPDKFTTEAALHRDLTAERAALESRN